MAKISPEDLARMQEQLAQAVRDDVGHSDERRELDIGLTSGAAVTDGKFDKAKIQSSGKYAARY